MYKRGGLVEKAIERLISWKAKISAEILIEMAS